MHYFYRRLILLTATKNYMHAGELSLDGFSQPFHDQYNIGAIHL